MKQNKTFKFGQEIYVAVGDYPHAGFTLCKGRITGVREYITASSALLYTIKTSRGGVVYAKPNEMYESVDDFKADVENHIV